MLPQVQNCCLHKMTNKRKFTVSSTSLAQVALLISEVRGLFQANRKTSVDEIITSFIQGRKVSKNLRTGAQGFSLHRLTKIGHFAWSNESWFWLQHSDGRLGIWCKWHESSEPSLWWCNSVGDIMWHTFWTPQHQMYPSLYPSSYGYLHYIPCPKAQITENWLLEQ